MAQRITKPILDTRTGKRYPSQAAAGRDLAHLVKGDPKDNWVWFRIARDFADRFRTRSATGQWVPLDDPTAPVGTLRADIDGAEGVSKRATRVTTVEIDEEKFVEVREALGADTLRETIDRAFDEVLTRLARERSIEQLQTMRGLDLDKPEVMAKAWR